MSQIQTQRGITALHVGVPGPKSLIFSSITERFMPEPLKATILDFLPHLASPS